MHVAMITLVRLRYHGIVLVQIKGNHILKTDPLLIIFDQRSIDPNGGRACGQSQHRFFPFYRLSLYILNNFLRNRLRQCFMVGANDYGNMFAYVLQDEPPTAICVPAVRKESRGTGYAVQVIIYYKMLWYSPNVPVKRSSRDAHRRSTA